MTLQFCIITPDSIFLNAEADEIILPTNTGQMGVLTGHAPLITALDIGVLLYRSKKKWISLALMGGFALIQQNNITVLVNEAENSSTIDPQEAQKTFELARQQFIEATNSKQKVSANFAFKRAQARYQVVQEFDRLCCFYFCFSLLDASLLAQRCPFVMLRDALFTE